MFRLRLHVMRLLGLSAESLATEIRNRETRQDDAARSERLGPMEGAIARAQAQAAAIQETALKVRGS